MAEPSLPPEPAFLVAVGPELSRFQLDGPEAGRRPGGVTLPAAVQYVVRHPSRPLLYAAYSNRARANDTHGVATLALDRAAGGLVPVGEPLPLPNRPIHLTVDPTGAFLLLAFNDPSDLTVHPLRGDGTPGPALRQDEPVEAGIYAHQVRVAPSGDLVVLSTRGNDPAADRPEEPGALKVFRFRVGQLRALQSVAEGGGYGFGPRHVDFHPTRPWLAAALERGNRLMIYEVGPDGLSPRPLFAASTLGEGAGEPRPQAAGAIHFHPNGRVVYVANRSDGTVSFGDVRVHDGGENSVAVFALAPDTGRPTLVQRARTGTVHARTFSIHPDGRTLVAASVAPALVRDGDAIRRVPAGLTVFDIAEDGRLARRRIQEVEVGPDLLFWCGFVPS